MTGNVVTELFEFQIWLFINVDRFNWTNKVIGNWLKVANKLVTELMNNFEVPVS